MQTPLTSRELEHFRGLLEEERDRQEIMVENIAEMSLNESMTESVGELSSYDQHSADAGAEMEARERDLGVQRLAEATIARIDDALERLQSGSYGVCVECDTQIPSQRLEALPYAERCIECAERVDPSGDRPAEEEALATPFSRTFTDDTDNLGFDGEDAWQAVGRMGTANSPQDDLHLDRDDG